MATWRWVVAVGLLAFGACSSPQGATCTAATCAGCCDSTGTCRPGNETLACGSPGSQCQACGAGLGCVGGFCAAAGGAGGGGGNPAGGGDGGGAAMDGGADDGGADDGGATVDAGTFDGVTGHIVRFGLLDDGGLQRTPIDPSGFALGAWVDEGDGGATFFPAVAGVDGAFSIPDVPQGRYILQAGTEYLVTASRAVNLDWQTRGRSGAAPATISPTWLNVSVSDLSPWTQYSNLSLFSWNANAILDGFDRYGTGAPGVGATTASVVLDYSLYSRSLGTPMIQASKGDQAWLLQSDYVLQGTAGTRQFVSGLLVQDLEQANGQSTNLTGAMTALRQDALTWDYRAADFATVAAQLNPPGATYAPYVDVQLSATLGPPGFTSDVGLPLVEFYAYTPDTPSASISFGNPYPVSWDAIASVSYQVVVERSLGTASPRFVPAELRTIMSRAALTSAPVRPVLGPVRQPLVNGLDLLVDRSGIGLRPTLSWQAPSLGTPSRYELLIERLAVQNGQTRAVQQIVVDTPDTSVTLPPGLLLAGQSYLVRVAAYSTSSQVDPNFFETALPFSSAMLVSGVLTP